ncbi:MAG: glycine cleavage system aminomethyltransferase GcvT [bacterium]
MSETTLMRTSLYERHAALGGKLVPFAGWEMPLQYAGIIAEHEAVRRAAGLFDVSHMGEFVVRGAGAVAFVDRMTTNSVASLPVGGIQYSVMLRKNGGVIDDLLVYRRADDVLLVVNASNREKDFAWLAEHAPKDVELTDRSMEYALIALQGPRSVDVMTAAGGGAFDALRYYTGAAGSLHDHEVYVSRTGYTGEDGFEILVGWKHAKCIWDLLLDKGAPHGIAPAGLGARDSLRLEMRFCLYGNDIDEKTNPLEAGLGWVVKLDKGDFMGRDALVAVKAAGMPRRLVGFVSEGREIPRHGYPIVENGRGVGAVTSGGFGPAVGKGIGMGYVPPHLASPGTHITVDCRGKQGAMQIVKGPFYDKGSHK